MGFEFSKEQIDYKNAVSKLLNSDIVQMELKRIHETDDKDWDARSIYKILGEKGYLAPNWPTNLGGIDKSFINVGILAETLSDFKVPEALYVLSVLIVGNLIMLSGSDSQKEKYLPQLASGNKYATILYSEPKAGSDLSALETKAIPREDGTYLLYGRKVYNMKTHLANYALCAARTSEKLSKYDGLTVFMVDLDQPGVHINPISSLSDECLFEILLDGAIVNNEDIIGERDNGWTVINKALTIERTGLDYYIRAKKWFEISLEAFSAQEIKSLDSDFIKISRLGGKLDCARFLTFQILSQIQNDNLPDETITAISKWYSSELACEVMSEFHSILGTEMIVDQGVYFGGLEAAYREAPGLTLSAGTSEMMLENISKLNFYLNNKEGQISVS